MDGKGKTEMGEWLRQHLPLKCSTAPPLFASCSITVLSVPGDCVAWAVPPRLTVWSGAVICNCRQAATCASRRPRSLVGSTEKCRRASALRSESRSVAPCAPAAFAAKQPDNKMCACCRLALVCTALAKNSHQSRLTGDVQRLKRAAQSICGGEYRRK